MGEIRPLLLNIKMEDDSIKRWRFQPTKNYTRLRNSIRGLKLLLSLVCLLNIAKFANASGTYTCDASLLTSYAPQLFVSSSSPNSANDRFDAVNGKWMGDFMIYAGTTSAFDTMTNNLRAQTGYQTGVIVRTDLDLMNVKWARTLALDDITYPQFHGIAVKQDSDVTEVAAFVGNMATH